MCVTHKSREKGVREKKNVGYSSAHSEGTYVRTPLCPLSPAAFCLRQFILYKWTYAANTALHRLPHSSYLVRTYLGMG
jgi:hypothetical protein